MNSKSKSPMRTAIKSFALCAGVAAVAGTANRAQAMPMISIYGLGNYNFYNQDFGTTQVRGSFGYGGGLMADFMLAHGFSFELAAAYEVQRAQASSPLAATVTSTSKAVDIPAGFNIRLGGMARLFLGGYYDLALTDGVSDDYGAAAGLRFRMGSVFFEPRFKYGFHDDPGNKLAEILVGYTFGAGK